MRLLKMEGFIDFFRSATPIDALELSSIGSRPSRRTGQKFTGRSSRDPVGIQLDAIPILFAWLVRNWQRAERASRDRCGRIRSDR